MRSEKRYTNETFTKRVDHDKGEHRQPYGQKEPAVCVECGAVYRHRRWNMTDQIETKEANTAVFTLCPACEQVRQGVAGGYVTVSGPFAKAHRDEIERLIANEAGRALEDNPLSRIQHSAWNKDGELNIETTTEHLAQRLGHALKSAFSGEVRFDFSHENKVARVSWHRG